PEVIERCIPQIKIIHEVNVSDDPEFKRAHEVLKKSERICFLGFGYDKTNLRRLFAPFDPGFLVKKMLCGTARGFTQAESNQVIRQFSPGTFLPGNPSWGNLEFLRQTGILH